MGDPVEYARVSDVVEALFGFLAADEEGDPGGLCARFIEREFASTATHGKQNT